MPSQVINDSLDDIGSTETAAVLPLVAITKVDSLTSQRKLLQFYHLLQ
jgi:hypothetical protein